MAWVFRTSRDDTYTGTTETVCPSVGPGSYNIECINNKNSIKNRPGYVAFNSSDVKNLSSKPQKTLITPGPGTYNTRNEFDSSIHVGPTSSFHSNTNRNTNQPGYLQTPGPGSYSVEKKGKNNFMNDHMMTKKMSNTKNPSLKSLSLYTPPSIPVISQSFGYEERPNGRLLPQNPSNIGYTGINKDQPGPGEYIKIEKTLLKENGIDFSKSKTGRLLGIEYKEKECFPGPGFYNTKENINNHKKDQKYRKTIKMSNGNKKRNLKKEKQELKTPGPGSYNISSDIITKKKKPETMQFFGSTSSRFNIESNNVISPGPGTYGETNILTSQLIKNVGFSDYSNHKFSSNIGFQSKENRFMKKGTNKDTTIYDIGPGSYEVPTLLSELRKKQYCRNDTFGSTTRRFLIESNDYKPLQNELERTSIQDSIENNNEKIKNNTRKIKNNNTMRSVFVSKTTRFNSQKKQIEMIPPPGAYEINRSWIEDKGKGILQSNTSRFTNNKTNTFVFGPGSYISSEFNSKRSLNRRGVFFGDQIRFEINKTNKMTQNIPGPGSYCTNTVDNQWNRPSFNITIVEEMEKAHL